MNISYDIIKLAAGIANIGIFFYLSIGSICNNCFRWWGILIALILMFLVVRSVSFMRGQESIWVFVLTMFTTIPFNIRLSGIIVNWYVPYFNIVTRILLISVVHLSLLSSEEIFLGLLARAIWPRQNESFFIGNRKIG